MLVVLMVWWVSCVFELCRTIYFNLRSIIMSNLCLNRETAHYVLFTRDYLLFITVTPKPKEIRYPCHTLLTPFLPSAIAIVVSCAIQGADFHI